MTQLRIKTTTTTDVHVELRESWDGKGQSVYVKGYEVMKFTNEGDVVAVTWGPEYEKVGVLGCVSCHADEKSRGIHENCGMIRTILEEKVVKKAPDSPLNPLFYKMSNRDQAAVLSALRGPDDMDASKYKSIYTNPVRQWLWVGELPCQYGSGDDCPENVQEWQVLSNSVSEVATNHFTTHLYNAINAIYMIEKANVQPKCSA